MANDKIAERFQQQWEKMLLVKDKTAEWVKRQWDKTPILIFAVGLCTIAITGTALRYTIAGYELQRHASDPELVTTGGLSVGSNFVHLDFHNAGRNASHRGVATLFGVDQDKDWTHKRKLGEPSMIGNVLPGYNAQADIQFGDQVGDLFLVCVVYYNGRNDRYQQPFLLGRRGGSLYEVERPSAEVCNGGT
jgi:hypothetical protein